MASPDTRRPRFRRRGHAATLLALVIPALTPAPAYAQDAPVQLEVALTGDSMSASRDPIVRTRNLLADTPWLSALRQGLPVRLQYRLEVWRSREGWFDVLDRQLEWTVVVRHEPLLDQFSVIRLLPPSRILQNRYATSGALAGALGRGYQFQVTPREAGQYYYAASLSVTTLSDSDLEELERILRGELREDSGGGTNLAQRARRLVLRLAGLPTLSLEARSAPFEVQR